MRYKVVKKFTDLQDKNHKYNVGDVYPREGYTPTETRVELLASDKNRQKTPLITVDIAKSPVQQETVEQEISLNTEEQVKVEQESKAGRKARTKTK